jgi:hypothetical protein
MKTQDATAKLTGDSVGSLGGTISNAPIVPEASNSGKVFRLFLLVLIACAFVYFFLHYR